MSTWMPKGSNQSYEEWLARELEENEEWWSVYDHLAKFDNPEEVDEL